MEKRFLRDINEGFLLLENRNFDQRKITVKEFWNLKNFKNLRYLDKIFKYLDKIRACEVAT